MNCSKMAKEYEDRVEKFMKFAIANVEGSSVVRCPCTKCMNLYFYTYKFVCEYLYFNGFNVS